MTHRRRMAPRAPRARPLLTLATVAICLSVSPSCFVVGDRLVTSPGAEAAGLRSGTVLESVDVDRIGHADRTLKGKHAATNDESGQTDADADVNAAADPAPLDPAAAEPPASDQETDPLTAAANQQQHADATLNAESAHHAAADSDADMDPNANANANASGGGANPMPAPMSSPCASARTCEQCQTVSTQLAAPDKTCYWSATGTCSEVDAASAGEALDCSAMDADSGKEKKQAKATAGSANRNYDYYDDDDDGLFGLFGSVLLFAFFGGVLYAAKKGHLDGVLEKAEPLGRQLMARVTGGGGTGGGSGEDGSVMGLTWATGLTSKLSGEPGDAYSGANAEMVPLSAATDDDEWGWEDGNDLEGGGSGGGGIGSSGATVAEEEDLHTALSNTLSDTRGPKNASGTASKSKASRIGRNRPGGSSRQQHHRGGSSSGISRTLSSGSNSKRQTVQSEAVPTSSPNVEPKTLSASSSSVPEPGSAEDIADLLAATRPSYAPAGMAITSLSKPKPTPKKKVEKKKPKASEDDDIFASMGLSSKPKFSAPSTSISTSSAYRSSTGSNSSSRPSGLSALVPVAKSTALSAAVEDMGDADGNWDEDSDLDDLLDE